MESRVNSLSSGLHAAADVAIATAAGLIAVLVCYPIYCAAIVVKAPLKKFSRRGQSDDAVERGAAKAYGPVRES